MSESRLLSWRDRVAVARALPVAIACCFLARPAFAHHGMDGATPQTLFQGLLSGLAHPVIGVDHLLFVLGVGLWSGMVGLRWTAPAAFVVATGAGCALHLLGFGLAFNETLISLSLAAVGVAILVARPATTAVPLALFLGAAGVLHGYAYGESIMGAEAGALGAYVVGFGAVQLALAEGARRLHAHLSRAFPERAGRVGPVWGSATCAAAAVFLVLSISG